MVSRSGYQRRDVLAPVELALVREPGDAALGMTLPHVPKAARRLIDWRVQQDHGRSSLSRRR